MIRILCFYCQAQTNNDLKTTVMGKRNVLASIKIWLQFVEIHMTGSLSVKRDGGEGGVRKNVAMNMLIKTEVGNTR